MASDLAHDGRAKGDVWYKVAVHDVDVDPVAVNAHEFGAGVAQGREVGGEDGGGDDGGGRHFDRGTTEVVDDFLVQGQDGK